jgi:hypothetical protein
MPIPYTQPECDNSKDNPVKYVSERPAVASNISQKMVLQPKSGQRVQLRFLKGGS